MRSGKDWLALSLAVSISTYVGSVMGNLTVRQNLETARDTSQAVQKADDVSQLTCPQVASLEQTCSAWLFNSNLKEAKARICQKR